MSDFDKVSKYYDAFMKLFKLYKIDEIKDLITPKGNEIIVDIGGGTGRLAEHFSKRCRKVYVLDESEGMLSKVKASEKIVPVLGDALNTNFESGSIDIVILSDVLHHIKEQQRLIEEVSRILKKNGRLVILDFEKDNFIIKLLKLFEYILFGKLYFRTSKEVLELLNGKFLIKKFINKGYYFVVVGEKKRCSTN